LNIVKIKNKESITPEIKEFFRDLKSSDNPKKHCNEIATLHTIGERTMPCMGNGFLLSEAIVEENEMVQSENDVKELCKALNIPYKKFEQDRFHVRPGKLIKCPCALKSKQESRRNYLKNMLGATEPQNEDPKLRAAYKKLLRGDSLYIQRRRF